MCPLSLFFFVSLSSLSSILDHLARVDRTSTLLMKAGTKKALNFTSRLLTLETAEGHSPFKCLSLVVSHR